MTKSENPKRQLDEREYLKSCFQPSDRLAIVVRNRRRGETLQRIAAAEKIVEEPFQQWLHFKNSQEGFDIYVGMNPLKPASRTRTKEDILLIRHLYADLDYDGRKSLAAIQESSLVPPPNYILSTSPDKLQVVWRVEGISQHQAEPLLRAIARKFDGDPAATDSTRVLRLPGFANNKYEERFVVNAEQQSHRVHHLLDFKLRIDHDGSPYPALRSAPPKALSTGSGSGALSQSEYDWAFAKRALARGANPEEVIRQIAEFRTGEKHDPEYYARHTVEKALKELTRSKSSLRHQSQDTSSEIPSLED
jgi:hypothetical protein